MVDMIDKKCGSCVYFCDEDGEPYCLTKDLYTEAKADDEACEYFC